MSARAFIFRHEWAIPVAAKAVTAALGDVEHYPRWWPQVRAVEPVDEASGRGRICSLLPMTLHLVLTREIEDREGGRLRVRLDGDLEGWAEWHIRPTGEGKSVAVFRQEVRVAPRLHRAATLAPFVLRANHAWMMRQGRRGLVRELTRRR